MVEMEAIGEAATVLDSVLQYAFSENEHDKTWTSTAQRTSEFLAFTGVLSLGFEFVRYIPKIEAILPSYGLERSMLALGIVTCISTSIGIYKLASYFRNAIPNSQIDLNKNYSQDKIAVSITEPASEDIRVITQAVRIAFLVHTLLFQPKSMVVAIKCCVLFLSLIRTGMGRFLNFKFSMADPDKLSKLKVESPHGDASKAVNGYNITYKFPITKTANEEPSVNLCPTHSSKITEVIALISDKTKSLLEKAQIFKKTETITEKHKEGEREYYTSRTYALYSTRLPQSSMTQCQQCSHVSIPDITYYDNFYGAVDSSIYIYNG
jgi:hypothetical protein